MFEIIGQKYSKLQIYVIFDPKMGKSAPKCCEIKKEQALVWTLYQGEGQGFLEFVCLNLGPLGREDSFL